MDQLSLPDRATSANNDPSPGALVNVYNQGTTDRATIYADEGAAAQHTNPVVCDGSGAIPQIFYNGGEDLEVVITTAGGVTLRTFDPVALIDDGTQPDGTEAEPGIRFTADPDTGFRRAGANDMRAVVGGADVATFTGSGLDVVGSIEVDGEPLFGTRDLASFGVTGSGDEDVAFEAALQWSAAERGRKLIGGKIEQVRITRIISATGHVQVDLSGVTIVKTTEAARIRWLNPPLANQALSSSYTAGDTTIDVDDLGAAYEAGTPYHIGSDAVDPANRDSGSSSSQYRVTEIGFLGTGSTNATLQLDTPLRRTVGISPTSTAGDEARIDPYTTAPDTELNPRVMIYNASTNVDVVLPNVEAPAGEDWASSPMFVLSGHVGGNIYLGKITRGYGPYLLLNGTVNMTVHGGLVQNLRNDPGEGAFGYGIENRGYGTRINGLNGSEVRHLFTTNAISIAANTTDADTRFATGRVEAFQLIGGTATGGDLAPWDTHHCADGGLFDNNVTTDTRGVAHLVRGRGVTVRNPAVTGAVGVGQVLTEFNSGSPDDDLYTAGKTRDDISEAIFDGVFAEGITGPIYKANHGVLTLTGGGRVTASHQTVIENEGGIFNVQDAPVFVLGGAGEDGEAIIKTTGVASQMSAVSGLGFTYINTDMTIDARGITATGVVGISCAAGTTTVVRGDLTLILPDGATLFSTTGTIITEGRGRILYRIDGTGTLNTDSHPGAVVRRTTTETWGGPLTPQDFGATDDGTTDYSGAIQAMCDACASTGQRGSVVGTYNVASATITDRTGGLIDWSQATLAPPVAGQTNPTLVIAPPLASLFSTADTAGSATKIKADAILAAVNTNIAAGTWKKGSQIIPELAAYAGHTIFFNTTQTHIIRLGGGGSYRYEMAIEVVDGDGRLLRPLPFDIPVGTIMANCEGQVIEPRATVRLPSIRMSSGTANRTSAAISIERSNTAFEGGGVVNTSAFTLTQGVTISKATNVSFDKLYIYGIKEASTGYGFNGGACSGVHFTDLIALDCRRAVDLNYSHGVTFTNPHCPDGMGGHWCFGTTIIDGAVGHDAPNAAPLHFGGGDLLVRGTKMSRSTVGPIFNQRGDVSEFSGQIILENVDMTWDYTGQTGTQDATIVNLDYPNSTHDFGRDLVMPALVSVSGTARVLGTGHTSRVVLFDNSESENDTNDIYYDTDFYTEKLKLVFENGTPTARVVGTRKTNWTGPGIRFSIRDLPDLTVFWGALSGHATNTAARATWAIDVEGTVDFRSDFEATEEYRVNCHTFTTSTAAGATSAVGDEQWWHSIRGGAPSFDLGNIADDAATSFAAPADYATILLTRREGGTGGVAAQFTADVTAGGGAFIQWSAGETVQGFAAVLAGTTQTDTQLNIGANSDGKIYIENRTGATIPGVVVSYIAAGR